MVPTGVDVPGLDILSQNKAIVHNTGSRLKFCFSQFEYVNTKLVTICALSNKYESHMAVEN